MEGIHGYSQALPLTTIKQRLRLQPQPSQGDNTHRHNRDQLDNFTRLQEAPSHGRQDVTAVGALAADRGCLTAVGISSVGEASEGFSQGIDGEERGGGGEGEGITLQRCYLCRVSPKHGEKLIFAQQFPGLSCLGHKGQQALQEKVNFLAAGGYTAELLSELPEEDRGVKEQGVERKVPEGSTGFVVVDASLLSSGVVGNAQQVYVHPWNDFKFIPEQAEEGKMGGDAANCRAPTLEIFPESRTTESPTALKKKLRKAFTPRPAFLQFSSFASLVFEVLEEICRNVRATSGKRQRREVVGKEMEEGEDKVVEDEKGRSLLCRCTKDEIVARRAAVLGTLLEVGNKWRNYMDSVDQLNCKFEAIFGLQMSTNPFVEMMRKTISSCFQRLREAMKEDVQSTTWALDTSVSLAFSSDAIRGSTLSSPTMNETTKSSGISEISDVTRDKSRRTTKGLPERAVVLLRAWLFQHFLHPYPTDVEKDELAKATQLKRSQVSNWFINARVRLWKPMIEIMYNDVGDEEHDISSTSNYTSNS